MCVPHRREATGQRGTWDVSLMWLKHQAWPTEGWPAAWVHRQVPHYTRELESFKQCACVVSWCLAETSLPA